MIKRWIPLGVALAAMAAASCQNMSNAELAGRVLSGAAVAAQGFFISEAQEIEIGQQTKLQVLASMPVYPNPTVRDYVTGIGQKLVPYSTRKGINYEFYVVENKEINAFAAPGGFLFVTTGALRLMTSEAQLAGVMGHEIAHVSERHSIEGIRQAMVAQGVATAALGQNAGQLAKIGANLAANLILKGFGRDAELESDRLGADYAYKAGYDPRELSVFLDALRKTSGEQPAWLVPISDHPRTDDRLSKIAEHIVGQKMELQGRFVGTTEFQAKVTNELTLNPPKDAPVKTIPTTGSPAPTASADANPDDDDWGRP